MRALSYLRPPGVFTKTLSNSIGAAHFKPPKSKRIHFLFSFILLHLHPLCCRPLEACSPRQMSVRPARRRRTSGPAALRTADPWSLHRRRRGHGAGPALWLRPAQTLDTRTGRGLVHEGPENTAVQLNLRSVLVLRMQITDRICRFRPRCICIWESHLWAVCFCFSALQWRRCPT